MKVLLLCLALALGACHSSAAATLDGALPDSALGAIVVGQTLTITVAERLGFEVAEALSEDKSDTKHDVLRLERVARDRTYFLELSVQNRKVQAEGWLLELADAPTETRPAEELARLVTAHGFPDDLIAEAGVQAVAWIDTQHKLRLEIIQQARKGDEPGELSAVLRRL